MKLMKETNHTIFGRKKEIDELLKDLQKKQKTIRLLTGESGVGKSALLNNYYKNIEDNFANSHFVGYYDRKNALISESILTNQSS